MVSDLEMGIGVKGGVGIWTPPLLLLWLVPLLCGEFKGDDEDEDDGKLKFLLSCTNLDEFSIKGCGNWRSLTTPPPSPCKRKKILFGWRRTEKEKWKTRIDCCWRPDQKVAYYMLFVFLCCGNPISSQQLVIVLLFSFSLSLSFLLF